MRTCTIHPLSHIAFYHVPIEVVVECYSGLEVFSILHPVSAVHYLPI